MEKILYTMLCSVLPAAVFAMYFGTMFQRIWESVEVQYAVIFEDDRYIIAIGKRIDFKEGGRDGKLMNYLKIHFYNVKGWHHVYVKDGKDSFQKVKEIKKIWRWTDLSKYKLAEINLNDLIKWDKDVKIYKLIGYQRQDKIYDLLVVL